MTFYHEKVNISASHVREMNYTDFIALIKETNRCPGGKKTIRRIKELIHIDNKTSILDVGSNTGFTSLEFAHISPANISGIDISDSCVREALELLSGDTEDVKSRVMFQVASAYDIPFSDNEFDVVMVGGATSFMDNKSRAITEYLRVLKPWGFLVLSPLTYHTQPPIEILNDVGSVIGVQINPMNKTDWINTVAYATKSFELYFDESHTLSPRTAADIRKYIDYFIHKDHIKVMSDDVKEAIKERWLDILKIFNENHKYLGYDIIIFRKRVTPEEPELFIGT